MRKQTGALVAAAMTAALGAGAYFGQHSNLKPQTVRGCIAIDGDTIHCGSLALRLNGIDAPELPGHCRPGRLCAPGDPFAAKASLAAAVNHHLVTYTVLKRDVYGRSIVQASALGRDLSCWQLVTHSAIYKPAWDDHKLNASCAGGVR